MAFKEINPGLVIFTAPKHRFALNNNFSPESIPVPTKTYVKQFGEIGSWKWWDADPDTLSSNLYPVTINNALAGCAAAGIALETLCVYTYGKGIGVFKRSVSEEGKEKITPVMKKEHQKFFLDNNIQNYCIKAITDYWTYANAFSILIKNKAGDKFVGISIKDAPFVRLGYQNKNTALIDKAFICGNWKAFPQLAGTTEIAVLDTEAWREQLDKNPKTAKWMMQACSYSPGIVYYHKHPWHAALDTGVFDLAPEIPKIRKSRFTNSLFIKYHVQIDESYWKVVAGETKWKEAEKKPEVLTEIKNKVYKAIDDHLGGTENAYKSMFSGKIYDARTGNVNELIKITPIETDFGDKAAFDPDKMSNVADIFLAFGLPMAIMNTVLNNAKSLGGGSDIREGIIAFQQRLKWHRDNILGPLDFAMRFNKDLADDEFLAFEDLIPTTLDVNPTGIQKTVA
jgi:hypothetical protein